jgi:nickel-type superoxide dismutase maturation protease
MAVSGAVAAVLGGAALTRWPLRRVTVEGRSMEPTLLPGDRVLTVPVIRPVVGDIVAVADPRQPERLIVKRVAAVSDLAVDVRGDAGSSTDSRVFGPVPRSSIRGRLVYRYSPSERSGRLGRGPAPLSRRARSRFSGSRLGARPTPRR